MGAEAEDHQQAKRNAEPVLNPDPNPNRITPDQFLSWKRQKDADASTRKAEAAQKRAEDIAAGVVQMNGRELFLHQPWVFDNDLY
ncbi:zinc finger CCCH domain-containing protein 15 [Ipomoea triloba]|uniref:zinc finger CCCH domain-containing protein 15 n=1 Tax=Ipomoea triloba TaxID=35885 RepID=UPI00125D104C|nr:zinc finger CCCH domain-containing protein 15 [Ipomoea triloba]